MAGLLAIGLRSARRTLQHLDPERVGVTQVPPPGAREVSFTSKDGLKLSGWFLPPSNGALVVLAHGHGENREQLRPELDALADAGFGSVAFDWRAHGNSEGDEVGWGFLERQDLTAAIDFALAQPGVDPQRLGVLGFSRGANVSLAVAAKDPRVKAVVAESGTTSLDEALERDFGKGIFGSKPARWVLASRGVDVAQIRSIDRVCEISPRPLLLIHGAKDQISPVEMGRALGAKACAGSTYWEIPNGGHGAFSALEPQYLPRVVKFFEAALGPSS
jgi:uncharacterized protein